jgi:hypothetical protein
MFVAWERTKHGDDRGFDMLEGLGFIPTFISAHDPRPVKEQIDANYGHGGGWRKSDSFTMGQDMELISKYPEDPDLFPLAKAQVRDEDIYFYDYAWTAIVQPDGSFEVARLD